MLLLSIAMKSRNFKVIVRMGIKCYRDILILKYWHVLKASSGSKGEMLWL